MLGFPQAQVLDITGPLEVFSRTARWLAEHRGTRVPAYTTEFVSARAGPTDTILSFAPVNSAIARK